MVSMINEDTEIHDTIRDNVQKLTYGITGSSAGSWISVLDFQYKGFGSLDGYIDEGLIKDKAVKFGFDKPSTSSFILANEALYIIKSNDGKVDHINPTEDGGVMIEFYHKDVYQFVNIYNDGEILYAKYGNPATISHLSKNLYADLKLKLNE